MPSVRWREKMADSLFEHVSFASVARENPVRGARAWLGLKIA
jgi:hypothetical protein